MHRTIKDAALALSLSNLSFLSAWQILLNPNHYSYYNWRNIPGLIEFAALAVDIFLLAALFWVLITVARRWEKPLIMELARWATLLILIIPIDSLLHMDRGTTLLGAPLDKKRLLLALVVSVAMLIVLVLNRRTAKRAAVAVVLILSPSVLVNFAVGLWLAERHRPSAESFQDKLTSSFVPETRSGPHILWIIFDEMDQQVAFAERPSSIDLPELDLLRHQAIFAVNAFPPAGATLLSIPALTTGKFVSGATPVRPDDLELVFTDNKVSGWSTEPNVFSRARQTGFRTAVVGWYLPYCRVLGSSLDFCAWQPVTDQVNPVPGQFTLAKGMRLWARDALYSVPFMFRVLTEQHENGRRDHASEYHKIMAQASSVWTREDLNLTLLHFPIPHAPWIYDWKEDSLSNGPETSYLGNLVLVDRTLSELRRSLELAGLWDRSTILVTSDHWWRESPTLNGKRDHRVPFILKMAGQKQGSSYDRAFNTIVTQDLLLELLQGKLSDTNSVLGWLDQHRSIGESPLTKQLP